MPVYNAEATLEHTLQSLAGQLTPQVELVIVDDGSTDSTSDILSRFASESGENCQILRQKNAGAAAARNKAIDLAKGDYLVFVDADDRLSERALETVGAELEDRIDILGWDWETKSGNKVRRFYQAAYSTPEEALKNLMGGTMKWNLWLYAVKRSLVTENGIRFLEGADMGEDMAFMLKCFSKAGTLKQIHEVLYEYNASNPASISQQLNERRRAEVSRNLSSAESFLLETGHAALCGQYMPHLKLFIKLPLLISNSLSDYRTWYDWFPEANAFAVKNPALPFRTRLLQWLASHRMWLLVKAYNFLYTQILSLLSQTRQS